MNHTYTRYSTSFKQAISAGILHDSSVPASTRAYWKSNTFATYKGMPYDSHADLVIELNKALQQSILLRKACKGLLILFRCTNHLLSLTRKRKKVQRIARIKIISAFEQAKGFLSVKTISKRLKVSSSKITHWKNEGKCSLSVLEKCPSLIPAQLTFSEQLLIRNYLTHADHKHLPINHIWALAQRNGLMIAENTFYSYAWKILGKPEKMFSSLKHPALISSRPFEVLHMDSTIVRCLNGERVYVHFIMDNFSRAILAASVSFSAKSATVAENLKSVFQKYNLEKIPVSVCSDDGPENHGEVTRAISTFNVKKIVAGYASKTSNNFIEAWNKKFKHVILKKFTPNSAEHLRNSLPEILSYSNSLFLPTLKTLSPNEVLDGKRIDELNVKEKMVFARKDRMEINRALNCKLKKC